MSTSKLISITPEKKDTILSKFLRFIHYNGFRTTLATYLRVPITDLYHPGRNEAKITASLYPTIPSRYRGLLALSYDACTGCRKCERACPNNTIQMHTRVIDGKEYRFPGYFAARCMFCGLCVEACDRQFAIRHTDQFEDAGFRREQLYYTPERMWALWDKHLQPKIDAGLAHKATPDKRRSEISKDVKPLIPSQIPGYLEEKAKKEAEKKARRAKK